MRLHKTLVPAVMIAVLASVAGACGTEDQMSDPEQPGPSAGSGYEIVTVETSVPDDWERAAGPRPEVSEDLVARMGDVGVALWQYQRGQDPQADVWLSPVSVYQALSMLAPGVGPEAIDELLAAMGLDADEIGVNTEQMSDWITASRRSGYQMALYNAAFVARQYGGFAPDFLAAIEPVRDELGGFDALDAEGTADLVNERVAEHTRGMIEQILTPGDIVPDLVTILLNTTYFKGTWVHQFDPAFTGEGEFTLLDGTVVSVPRMSQMSVPLAVIEADGYAAAVLPYEGGAKAVIVLPDPGRFEAVAADLTAADLRELAAADIGARPFELSLPKFTSDSGIQELTPALQSAGVSRLFTWTPDWPMFDNADRHTIAFVKHRVVVEVNELGTEAAAATAIGGVGSALPLNTFVVNRPFVMAILDADDAVLFLGQVTDPR